MTPEPFEPDVPLWAVRLEAKVDVALTQHTARLDNHSHDLADHETRMRVLEARKTVTPSGLWSAVLGAVTAVGVLFSVFGHHIPI